MSKLDNIILDCVNKALDGKEEKLGDYVDPTKDQIKALMLELIGKDYLDQCEKYGNSSTVCNKCFNCAVRGDDGFEKGYEHKTDELRKKVEQL